MPARQLDCVDGAPYRRNEVHQADHAPEHEFKDPYDLETLCRLCDELDQPAATLPNPLPRGFGRIFSLVGLLLPAPDQRKREGPLVRVVPPLELGRVAASCGRLSMTHRLNHRNRLRTRAAALLEPSFDSSAVATERHAAPPRPALAQIVGIEVGDFVLPSAAVVAAAAEPVIRRADAELA